MTNRTTLTLKPEAAALLKKATAALAALGLNAWTLSVLATAVDIVETANDPDVFEESPQRDDVYEVMCETAIDVRCDEIIEAMEHIVFLAK